jgi:hypothetical protein
MANPVDLWALLGRPRPRRLVRRRPVAVQDASLGSDGATGTDGEEVLYGGHPLSNELEERVESWRSSTRPDAARNHEHVERWGVLERVRWVDSDVDVAVVRVHARDVPAASADGLHGVGNQVEVGRVVARHALEGLHGREDIEGREGGKEQHAVVYNWTWLVYVWSSGGGYSANEGGQAEENLGKHLGRGLEVVDAGIAGGPSCCTYRFVQEYPTAQAIYDVKSRSPIIRTVEHDRLGGVLLHPLDWMVLEQQRGLAACHHVSHLGYRFVVRLMCSVYSNSGEASSD